MEGKARTKLLAHSAGLVEGSVGGPSWDFLYQATTVKHPDYNIGDRVCLPDGRVFRYCLEHTSSHGGAAAVEAGRGVKFVGEVANDGLATTTAKGQAVGDDTLDFAAQTFAEDELRGGYMIVYSAGSTYQQFGIVGNNACSGTTLTVKLDRKFTTIVASGQYCEACPNPYRYIGRDTSGWNSVAGVPMSSPTSAEYFWIQTWGPLWCNPGPDGMGGAALGGERRVIFNVDGSLRTGETGNDDSQTAGFIIDMTLAGTDSPPFIMLQISP